MSAFMCDNQHLVLLVAGGFDYHLVTTRSEAQVTGQMLADANAASLLTRYWRDDLYPGETDPKFELTETTEGTIRPVWLLKAIACWDYQSCEYDEHRTSDARRWCDQLETAIFARHPELGMMVPGRYRRPVRAWQMTPDGDTAPTWDFAGRLADAIEDGS